MLIRNFLQTTSAAMVTVGLVAAVHLVQGASPQEARELHIAAAAGETEIPELPELSSSMITGMDAQGAEVDVTTSPLALAASSMSLGNALEVADRQQAAEAAYEAFSSFVEPEDLTAESYASVTVPRAGDIDTRQMWVVYLTGVQQPIFGSPAGEVSDARMMILADPITLDMVWARAY